MTALKNGMNAAYVAAHRLCHGCGACAYICPNGAIELRNFIDEGIRPVVDARRCESCGDCMSVCSGIEVGRESESWPDGVIEELAEEWGPVLEVWEGHATEENCRYAGSSGGAATAFGQWCVEKGEMHGVLHVRADAARPYLNKAALSRSWEELFAGVGSRYSPAAPCGALSLIEKSPGACAMIGKPCDIAAAVKASRLRPALGEKLGLTISIFCGGTPSTRGTLKLLERLGVDKGEAKDLRYRGHGWPGAFSVGISTGRRVEMSYREAWDETLTGYRPRRCQACPDHTGEFADLACGDPWHRRPAAGEAGDTLILVRTERGRDAFREALCTGYIEAVPRSVTALPRSQRGLLNGRRHVFPKIAASMLAGAPHIRTRGLRLFRGWLRLSLRRMAVSFIRALRYAVSARRRGPLTFSELEISEAELVEFISDADYSDDKTSKRLEPSHA